MKKTVSVCMTAVMALSLLAGGAVQAYALSAETAEPVLPWLRKTVFPAVGSVLPTQH